MFFYNFKTNDGSHKQLKSYASVTISVQDLQLLKDMAAKKDFDYMEIDRILHSMFTPVIKSEFNFKESENLVEIYHQVIMKFLDYYFHFFLTY